MPMQPFGLMGYWDHAAPADWAEVLATFPLFSGLDKRRLRKLARQATFAEYSRGDIVIAKGDPGDALYVILSGSAMAQGKPAARMLRTGDYFGELGLLDGVARSATVVATDELHVMRLTRRSFLRAVEHDPSISLRMLSTLGSQIRRRETQAA